MWSCDQDPGFDRLSLRLVLPLDARSGKAEGNTIVAVDLVGARTGDAVLVVYEGSSSRMVLGTEATSAEAVIVGIVDQISVVDGGG